MVPGSLEQCKTPRKFINSVSFLRFLLKTNRKSQQTAKGVRISKTERQIAFDCPTTRNDLKMRYPGEGKVVIYPEECGE